jgi:cytochrome b pre-mRNA-processing protein 3
MAKLQQQPGWLPPSRPWWRRLWRRDSERPAQRAAAHQLYIRLVNQARSPEFYGALGVPDTPEGRFEMVALHACLVLRRLRADDAAGQAIGQELFDLMFVDMDASLRELGVGDLSVGKYVKRLASNFYARIAALDEALATRAAGSFEPLWRNVYHGAPAPSADQLRAFADYLSAQDRRLATQPAAALRAGEVSFGAPPDRLTGAA